MLICALLHRFFNICIKYENSHAQIEFFRKILNQNGYPTRLFDRCVGLFLNKTFQPKELIHSVFHIPEHTLSKSVPKFNAFAGCSLPTYKQ
jgi:hypothetical protein